MKLNLLFIDFVEAIDSINQDAIWRGLVDQEVAKTIIETLEQMYKSAVA